jgi:hypothetical protein
LREPTSGKIPCQLFVSTINEDEWTATLTIRAQFSRLYESICVHTQPARHPERQRRAKSG